MNYFMILLVSLAPLWSCSASQKPDNTATVDTSQDIGQPPSGFLPKKLTVAGQLAISSETKSAVGGASAGSQALELLDQNNNVISTGKSTPTGIFQLAIDSSSMELTDAALELTAGDDVSSSMVSGIVTLKSLFLAGGAGSESALGVKRQIFVTPDSLSQNPNGDSVLSSGVFEVKKVSAIIGKITLETGEDAAGIDVYIPSTTHIAKTDTSGKFILGFIPQGTYDLRADRDGYASLEWKGVTVGKGETASLAPLTMQVGRGPAVLSFAPTDGGALSLTDQLSVTFEAARATKYRMSLWEDFRDTSYAPLDLSLRTYAMTANIWGDDGEKTLYLEVADSDGLTASHSFSFLLDTKAPKAPGFKVVSENARDGFTHDPSSQILVESCDDTTKVFLTEDGDFVPEPGDFTQACDPVTPFAFTLSSGDGQKSLLIYALDQAGRVSESPGTQSVTLDTLAPALTITPAVNSGDNTILTSETTELVITGAEDMDLYYTFNPDPPTLDSQKLSTVENTGRLVLVDNATLKIMGVDFAGNASPVITRQIQIDRQAPIFGAISAGVVTTNNLAVPLTLAANGATSMAFSESVAGLQTATAIAYSTSHTYTLTDTTDGVKTIYVVFRDDGGNALGAAGDLSTQVTLDRTAPTANKIVLLEPESPTGAYNTPLAWKESFTDEEDLEVTYEIEVCPDAAYSTSVRTMTTTGTLINITPALANAGTYYWRVRAKDPVGNATDWATSGTEFRFTVGILAQDYQAQRVLEGTPWVDRSFGRDMTLLDNGDLAIGILESKTDTCANCGKIDIYNRTTGSVDGQVTENLPPSAFYGHRMITCNVLGDSAKELVVAAPGEAVSVTLSGTTVKYNNMGAVYVYDATGTNLLQKLTPNIPPEFTSHPLPGYYSCKNYGAQCIEYGWPMWPSPIADWINRSDSRYFGWSLTCSGTGSLFVGEPFYYNSSYIPVGRVLEYKASGSTLGLLSSVVGSGISGEAFGYSSAYLQNFSPSAPCTSGPVLAVGSPMAYDGSGYEKGAAALYQKSGSTWSQCGTSLLPDGGDPAYCRYGQGLFNLGNIDKDGSSIEELAVSGSCYSGGVVRIYGSTPKSYRSLGEESAYLGYEVRAAGDFDGDGQSELAISIPGAKVNGQWGAGKVLILDWASMADNSDTTGSLVRTITGQASSWAYMGARFIPVLAPPGDIHSDTLSAVLSNPGKMIEGAWGVGAMAEYALVKMAPGLPYEVEGTLSNEGLGSTIIPAPDMNSDGAPDVILGRPGGLCEGAPTGVLSIYSVLDGGFGSQICGDYTNQRRYIGSGGLALAQGVLFFAKGSGYVVNYNNFSNFTSVDDTGHYPFSSHRISINSVEATYSEPIAVATPSAHEDILIGNPRGGGGAGNTGSGFAGSVDLYEAIPQMTQRGSFVDATVSTAFGRGLSFIPDVNGDTVRDILIGAPGAALGGVVYLIDGVCGAAGTTTIPTNASCVLSSVDGDTIFSTNAKGSFGSFILGLPDYDSTGGKAGFFLASNTNIRVEDSSRIPQYAVIGITRTSGTPDTYSFTVMHQDTGTAGGMLGGYAKTIPDINGDGKEELAVSYPGGTGRLGQTGHIRLFSGAGLATTSTTDDLIQRLFSPAQVTSNFGSAFEYVDFDGDGLKDFVVGANLFSGRYSKSGALFVFPMSPIQD
jgi:hypothetical protein